MYWMLLLLLLIGMLPEYGPGDEGTWDPVPASVEEAGDVRAMDGADAPPPPPPKG